MTQQSGTQPVGWAEQFNCHTLLLARGAVKIVVNWTGTRVFGTKRYDVLVNGLRLKDAVDGLDEAKQAGIRLARRVMANAAHELAVLEGKVVNIADHQPSGGKEAA